ncbi:head-tail connector protein [Neisseria musculi]|uniref:Phage gp6-like head-tail connector family protein n=1 Tax=Neisseria musculi TaxID=1815583 RepID=A0A7H1MCJ2_9NEIS|nr:head-tail connector protein [Neisseria musculi]QNT59357.1 phage gp6-like head-tail connector family protein [Neisseria musculi]
MVTLEQIRGHCRIDDDSEDALLEQYRQAALETLKTQTGRNWYGEDAEIPATDPDGLHYTAAAVQALLLLIGGWYQNRESASAQNEIPAAFWHLVQPYRLYGV